MGTTSRRPGLLSLTTILFQGLSCFPPHYGHHGLSLSWKWSQADGEGAFVQTLTVGCSGKFKVQWLKPGKSMVNTVLFYSRFFHTSLSFHHLFTDDD